MSKSVECDHNYVTVMEQYCGGMRFVTKCMKCDTIKLED